MKKFIVLLFAIVISFSSCVLRYNLDEIEVKSIKQTAPEIWVVEMKTDRVSFRSKGFYIYYHVEPPFDAGDHLDMTTVKTMVVED